jgi:acyl-coenzyme A synthetase/AMP-(fatty) acid ligase
MDASVVGDLLARERRGPETALYDAARDRCRSYRDVCTTAYKAGNFLRYLGVDGGDTVGIAAEARPQPLFTFLGGALLGAVTRFDASADAAADAAALLVSVDAEASVSAPPGTKLAVYGGAPARPDTVHWEETVWSENPAFPPTPVDPADPLVAAAGGSETHSHASVLAAARDVVEEWGLGPGDGVAVRASLSDPHTVAAGVVAPLLAGGHVVLPASDGAGTDAAVAVGDGPEPSFDPGSVPL